MWDLKIIMCLLWKLNRLQGYSANRSCHHTEKKCWARLSPPMSNILPSREVLNSVVRVAVIRTLRKAHWKNYSLIIDAGLHILSSRSNVSPTLLRWEREREREKKRGRDYYYEEEEEEEEEEEFVYLLLWLIQVTTSDHKLLKPLFFKLKIPNLLCKHR